jgi:hypothetical protein
MDILTKFANLKASIPSQGTLMNYLISLIELHAPNLLPAFTELSPAILASAEVSYKQLTTDMIQLEQQFNKMKMEFERIKITGKENPGLDNALEEFTGKSVHPFYMRLKNFVDKCSPVMNDMKKNQKSMEDSLNQILMLFGESLKGGKASGGEGGAAEGGESDIVKKFFGMILEFSRSFQTALEENKQRKAAQEKLLQQQQHQGDGKDDGAHSPKGGAAASTGTTKELDKKADIFGQFHKAQKASNDQLLAEFKNKLNKQKAGQ